MSSPCNPNVVAAGNMSQKDSEALIQQLHNRAQLRAAQTGQSIKDSLKDIAGEIKATQETMNKIHQRNNLMDIQSKLNLKQFAKRFPSVGEGLRALLVGSNKNRQGARMSVDYQAKSNNAKYFDKLVSGLEAEGVLNDFKRSRPDFVQDVYREMGAMHPGQPAKQVTQNANAHKAAKVIDSVYSEMIARQNRGGSFITRMPGYIIRQTHDMSAIRSVGKIGNTPESRNESFKNWWDFTKPLLDHERTFQGADPEKTARLIHEGLYSGKHGPAHEETDAGYAGRFSDLAKKISSERVLHFKGPDEAYKYNQAFGIKNFREAVISDIHSRSRQMALLENLGPHFERNFEEVKNELAEEMRSTDAPSKHIDSLRDWKLQADFNEVTGKNEFSANPTLSKYANFLKVNAQLSKMGAVVLSKVVDMGAITSEMMHNGLNSLQTMGRGLRYMAHTSADERGFARKLGVGIESMIGNALSRFEEHSSVYGWSHELQKRFYSMSLLPRWNDALRSSVAVSLSNNLGEHAHLSHEELPGPLKSMLTQYDISPSRWDAMRSTAYEHNGEKFISPDRFSHDVTAEQLGKLVEEDGKKPTMANMERMRDRVETSLRTYFADRADYAIPTPGAKERKFSTLGTQAGTPLGEFVRLAMMFKSFPITIMSKVLGRDVYGNGADSVRQWMLHDNRGKVNMAMTIAMMTAAGYVSQSLHDMVNGKAPMPLVTDGKINWDNIQQIMVRGGSLGLYGETTMGEFSGQYRSFLEYAAGPTFGQLDNMFDMTQSAKHGKNISWPATKMLLDNAPFTNLFYLRPVLNYLVLWHLQEMLSPGSLERSESRTETQNHQNFLIRPSEHDR
jgi:hypothetical protein